jgi:putative transposase
MTYHYAVPLRIYPNRRQRRIIAKNDGVSRKTYNNLVSFNEELFRLCKVKIYSEPIQNRIDFLREILGSKAGMLVMMPFAKDDEIDSLAIDNAYADYRSAWNQFKKIPGTQKPCFHKKSYEQRYKSLGSFFANTQIEEVRFKLG